MYIKSRNFYYFVYLFSFYYLYLIFLVLNETIWFSPLSSFAQNYGAYYIITDSTHYMQTGKDLGLIISSLYITFLENSSSIISIFNNITLFAISYFANTLTDTPYAIVILINLILFTMAFKNYIKIIKYYNLDINIFYKFMAFNLLIPFSLITLNKEALGIFIISSLLRHLIFKNHLRFILMLLIAFFTKSLFFYFGVFLYINMYFIKNIKIIFIVMAFILYIKMVLSGGFLFGDNFGNFSQVSENTGQRSAFILKYSAEIMTYPFGYLISYFITGIVQLFAPMLNYGYYFDLISGHYDLNQIFLQISSILFFVLLYKIIKTKRYKYNIFFSAFFIYTLFVFMLPFSGHRYLLPIFPILILAYLYKDHIEFIKRRNFECI